MIWISCSFQVTNIISLIIFCSQFKKYKLLTAPTKLDGRPEIDLGQRAVVFLPQI